MKHECEQLAALLSGYVDNELCQSEKEKVQGHLSKCPDCAAGVESEKQIKAFIADKYCMEAAPSNIKARIRHQLKGMISPPGFIELLREAFVLHRLKGALALASLFLIATLPYFVATPNGVAPALPGLASANFTENEVALDGEIVCIDCELLKSINMAPEHQPGHRKGFRDSNNAYWNFIYTSESAKLLENDAVLGAHMRVKGFVNQAQHYIKLEGYQQI